MILKGATRRFHFKHLECASNIVQTQKGVTYFYWQKTLSYGANGSNVICLLFDALYLVYELPMKGYSFNLGFLLSSRRGTPTFSQVLRTKQESQIG
jgi:hypothetical protein